VARDPKAFSLKELGAANSTLHLVRHAWSNASDDVLDCYRIVWRLTRRLGFLRRSVNCSRSEKHRRSRLLVGRLITRSRIATVTATSTWLFERSRYPGALDKLGNNATVAMHDKRRLARLHDAVVAPVDAPDDTRHTIIEV
jgi:hypothetical protein